MMHLYYSDAVLTNIVGQQPGLPSSPVNWVCVFNCKKTKRSIHGCYVLEYNQISTVYGSIGVCFVSLQILHYCRTAVLLTLFFTFCFESMLLLFYVMARVFLKESSTQLS